MPIMPRMSGCEAGKPPSPSSVEATGICSRSARARTCSMRAGLNDAVSGKNDGALGSANQLCGFEDGVCFGAQHGMGAIGPRRGRGEVEVGSSLLRVLGDVDQHWAGTARLRDAEALRGSRARYLRRA